MSNILRLTLIIIALSGTCIAQAQERERGNLSGDLQLVARFYEADSARQAVNTPFYDYLFYEPMPF
ncbi:MAG: hypothetical protein IPL33_01600 [Sphingobacteriales bacterium]|nr:hypothetical protein [Sphingobacteriales bacterium]